MSEEKKEKKVPTVLQGRLVDQDPTENLACGCETDDLDAFIRASQAFKNTLWEKLWRMLKGTYHLLMAASALQLS